MESTAETLYEIDETHKMGRYSLAMAWYGLVSAMFFLYIGAALASAYGTVNALIGLALTIVVYTVINRILAAYAMKNSMTVAQFSRSLLGRSGAWIATLILAATAFYYAVFEGTILAYAFQAQFGGEIALWFALVVLITIPLVAGGVQKWLDKFNGWLLPIYWGGLIAAVIWASVVYGYSNDWITHVTPEIPFVQGGPGWLATFGSFMGVWVLMMYTFDFASLGKGADIKFHQRYTFGGLFYLLAFGANALVGIFLTFAIPGLETTESGVAGGIVAMMGPIGLLVVFVSQMRINTANYSVGIANLREFGERALRIRIPGAVWAILGGIIIFLLMLLPIVQYLLLALSWQGALVTGWVGIALVHIAMDRRKGITPDPATLPDSRFRRVNRAGVTAWVVSAAIGIVLIQSGLPWGATVGSIITPAIAALLYRVLRTAFGRAAVKEEAPEAVQQS